MARKRRGESCDLWEVTGQLCVLWLVFAGEYYREQLAEAH